MGVGQQIYGTNARA